MIINKHVLKKIHQTPIYVSIWNGNFKKAELFISVNRRIYQIEVYGTHKILEQFVSNTILSEPVSVWYNHFKVKDIPEELNCVIDSMKELVKMDDKESLELYQRNLSAIEEFNKCFCI